MLRNALLAAWFDMKRLGGKGLIVSLALRWSVLQVFNPGALTLTEESSR